MAKSYNRFGNNAQTSSGWLSNLPSGECTQLTPNGMTKTEGMFKIDMPAIDAAPTDPNYYHRPWYGQLQGKQISGDKK
jgi:hypothetical protein